jgi:hypothetical protein
VYVNGFEANSKPVIGALNPTARPMGIGNNPVDGGQYFNGGLDELKIYNRALTPEEIEKLFNNGTVSVEDLQLVHQYVNQVFPNPATNFITVNHQLPDKQDVIVNIYDIAGKQVARKHIPKTYVSSGQFTMDVTGLQEGNYFMNIIYGGKNLGSIGFIKL